MKAAAKEVGPKTRPLAGNASVRMAAVLGFLLAALCGLLDWLTGPEIGSSVVYLIPVTLVAWRGCRWLGLTMAFLCGLIWAGIDLATNDTYTHTIISYWNALVRLTIFCFIAVLVSEVAKRKRVEAALRQAAAELAARAQELSASEVALGRERSILQSVLNSMCEGVVVVDAQGQIVLSNSAAAQLLQVAAAPPDSPPPSVNGLPALADRISVITEGELLLAKARRGEQIDAAEICLPDLETPTETWLLVNGRPLLGMEPAINGGVLVFNDISARRRLERQIAEVSDREQRRLGQDLHDGLCQQLVSLAFAARLLADKLRETDRPESSEADQIAKSLNDAITQARDVARGLYLVQIEVGGLASALEELAAQVRTHHRLNCTFVERCSSPLSDTFAAVDLFRIAQEAVRNAIKHANAKTIAINFDADESCVTLRVQDDGIGIEQAGNQKQGMGLHIMEYRARMIGATLSINGMDGGGTQVNCALPRRNSQHTPT